MKKMKQFISALLLISLLASVSCGGAGNADTGTSAPEQTDGTTTAEETTISDSLPSDLNYGGETFTMLVNGSVGAPEFFVDEQNGDVVNDAIYNRNARVSERLNVNFEFIEEPGAFNERKTFAQRVSQSVLANDSTYDAVAGYSMAIASLAADNMLIDLNSMEYIDLAKPWWSQNLMSQSSVNGKLYFASGDISTTLTYMMYAMYFNKNIMAANNIEEPYDLVLDGKWTLDKLLELSTGVYQDLNGDGQKKVDDDLFGLETYAVYVDPYFYSCGLRTTELDADGVPQISTLFGSEQTQALIEKLVNAFFATNDCVISGYDSKELYKYFEQNRFMFSARAVQYGVTNLRNADFEYGILPMPKWDEAQEDYYTIASFPYSLYCIPLDAKDSDMSSAVLEALASESSKLITPAVFEVALKVKYSSDDKMAQMYDIIRASMTYDFGRVFTDNLDSLTYSMFRDSVVGENTNWASTYAKKEKTLQSKMDKLLEKFGD